MKKLVIAIVAAFVLWFVMFSPLTAGNLNFWLTMSLSAVVLTVMALAMRGRQIIGSLHFSWRDLALGVGSAAVLWGVFWLGNYFSNLLFDFAQGQVAGVYAMKTGENQLVIALLLLFVIGPAEEIFWHGLVQSELTKKIPSPWVIVVTTLIYSLVHLPSLNFLLIMAAFVCGLFWSAIYYYNRNLLTVIVSHALWDVSVFVLFPIS
jgi:membrane protease YdiL (CAAX protease family)